MGRGLSELQKWVLSRALAVHDKHEAGDLSDPHAEISRFDVFDDWFNWPRIQGCEWRKGKPWIWQASDAAHIKYDKKLIGEKVYASKQVVVSHAFQRLQRRGLLKWSGYLLSGYRTGYWLTPKGVDTARMLSVN